jgi:hypothetical protein
MLLMWTLWLVIFGSVIGQGGAPATVTPLSTFPSEAECRASIYEIGNGLAATYGKKNTPNPGVFFCVGGAQVKR